MTTMHPPWSSTSPPGYTPCSTWHATHPAHLAIVRREVRTMLAGADVGPDGVDDLLMVIDELLSNGLRHGSPPVTLEVCPLGDLWLIAVTDHAPTDPPRPTSTRDPVLGGMGLGMVATLAMATGWHAGSSSKQVWATVDAAPCEPVAAA